MDGVVQCRRGLYGHICPQGIDEARDEELNLLAFREFHLTTSERYELPCIILHRASSAQERDLA